MSRRPQPKGEHPRIRPTQKHHQLIPTAPTSPEADCRHPPSNRARRRVPTERPRCVAASGQPVPAEGPRPAVGCLRTPDVSERDLQVGAEVGTMNRQRTSEIEPLTGVLTSYPGGALHPLCAASVAMNAGTMMMPPGNSTLRCNATAAPSRAQVTALGRTCPTALIATRANVRCKRGKTARPAPRDQAPRTGRVDPELVPFVGPYFHFA
jgi:hypothetical protein